MVILRGIYHSGGLFPSRSPSTISPHTHILLRGSVVFWLRNGLIREKVFFPPFQARRTLLDHLPRTSRLIKSPLVSVFFRTYGRYGRCCARLMERFYFSVHRTTVSHRSYIYKIYIYLHAFGVPGIFTRSSKHVTALQ